MATQQYSAYAREEPNLGPFLSYDSVPRRLMPKLEEARRFISASLLLSITGITSAWTPPRGQGTLRDDYGCSALRGDYRESEPSVWKTASFRREAVRPNQSHAGRRCCGCFQSKGARRCS